MYQIFTLLLFITTTLKCDGAEIISISAMNGTNTSAFVNLCVWSTCNVTGYASQYSNYSLDCCTLQLPLNYAKPDRIIAISMLRLRPSQSTITNNTMFILMGGPGQSGWAIVENVALLIPATSGITLVLPDHRGTGLSTALGCDDKGSQNITADCITYLTSKFGVEGLNQFSITSAAHDLSVQIQSYQLEYPERIGVYAVSAGTQWLDRFLQIYPTLVQSAVMDGVVNPLLTSISRFEIWASVVGVQFLTYCQVQPECNKHFPDGQSPQIMLYRILSDLDANQQQCINAHFTQYQLTSDKIRNLFYMMMATGDKYMDRTVIPAVIFRLNRCNAADVTALSFFFQKSFGSAKQSQPTPNGPGFLYSSVLNYNIIQSEGWLALNESEVDEETLVGWHNATIIAPNLVKKYISLRSQWPKYPLDQYSSQVASFSPLLMLSGLLDPSTLFHEAAQLASITASTRTFHGMPLVGHVTTSLGVVGYYCPKQLMLSWLFPNIFPVEWRDPKCIQDLPTTIDFVGATSLGQQYSIMYLNVSLPFGNDTLYKFKNRRTEPVQHSNPLCRLACVLLDAFFS